MKIRIAVVLLLQLYSFCLFAQKAKITGIVTDPDGIPIDLADVQVRGTLNGAFTNEKGIYSLSVTTGDSCTLVFSCLGYNKTMRVIPVIEGDMEINVRMRKMSFELGEVTVTGSRRESSSTLERIDTRQKRLAADATGGSIETIVVTAGMGTTSHSELSSQYSVRGGNYDENIVYVNGIEVYRPLLIRSGQQEGLSFINPDLTEGVSFSSGGFEARYGDKMSSVLDVTYKKPEAFEGAVSASMLGGNIYLGSSTGKFTQVTGFRYKRGTTLLKTLDTKGDYEPTFIDLQTYMTYSFTKKWSLSVLGNFSENTYDFIPSKRKTTYGTLRKTESFEVHYDGSERDRFRTLFGAATLKYDLAEHADIGLQVSAFQSREEETYDIGGEYWLSNVISEDESDVIGTGIFHDHARDYLQSEVVNTSLTGSLGLNKNTIRWAIGYQREIIKDRIKEWEMRDSMGYLLPYNEDLLRVYSNLYSHNDIASNRFFGYIQDTYKFRSEAGLFSITAGVRGSYWNFNKEFIFSPRASFGFIPAQNQNFTFRFATGIYYQSPFYKEFRVTQTDEDGNSYITLNEDIRSQRSLHFVLGGDYSFRKMDRPFKFRAEMYYKKLSDLVPYTVDNVKVTYLGYNASDGYAVGLDMKLFGEFVPRSDSWLGLSLMKTEQTLNGKKLPLPTDQRYNITFFFTDYFPNYERVQFNLRAIWADGLPFSLPGNPYENVIRAPAYRRIDIGMNYCLLNQEDSETKSSPWRYFKNIWVGVDVFNLFDIGNVSSYSWFTDVRGNQHAVPDKLTGRQLNIKLIADF